MQAAILALGLAILLASAYSDVRMRRIPNVLTYSLAVLGALKLLLIGDPSAALWTISSAAAVLVGGFLLFWGGFVGGGEVKLLIGSVLLIGARDLLGFFWLVSLCTAVAMLALLIEYDLGRWLRRAMQPTAVRRAVEEGAQARPTVPYGIAIAMGAGMMLLSRLAEVAASPHHG
jgi:prepilin peptidase CpaA